VPNPLHQQDTVRLGGGGERARAVGAHVARLLDHDAAHALRLDEQATAVAVARLAVARPSSGRRTSHE
jgi:hypothetical protein